VLFLCMFLFRGSHTHTCGYYFPAFRSTYFNLCMYITSPIIDRDVDRYPHLHRCAKLKKKKKNEFHEKNVGKLEFFQFCFVFLLSFTRPHLHIMGKRLFTSRRTLLLPDHSSHKVVQMTQNKTKEIKFWFQHIWFFSLE
jgi:hypothetical protein